MKRLGVMILLSVLLLGAGCVSAPPREPFHASHNDAELIAHVTKHLHNEYSDLDLKLFQSSVDREKRTATVNFGRHWSEVAKPDDATTRMMVEIVSVLIDEKGVCHSQRSKHTVLEIPNGRENI